ncbi:MAG: glucose-6-phosphate dehydrogenase (coenzyme-F420) [Chloroflexi bacterium]|nr:glucose-6-phosphate dehydrogenase (coenzyme-F420) [Chloroflexota bacterium]
MLKIGYKASAEQFAPRPLLEFAVQAEVLGFDSVMLSDHFQPWRYTDGHSPFSLAWLAALGERTTRVQMGTSVMTPTFRLHPSVVAHAFATLGCLYPGRVILGVGTGESLNEVSSTGIAWPDSKERFARLKESIELMRRLWSEEFVTHNGLYYKTVAATLYDRPAGGVPVYIAATGEAAARLAGRVADGFICTSGKPRALYLETLLPAVADGATKAARDQGTIEKLIEMKVSYDPDRQRALEDTRNWAALALSAEDKLGVEDPREMERRANALPLEKAASRWIVSDDPDEHIQKIGEYIAMGFTHLVLHMPGQDQARAIALYAKDILPRLRQKYA